MLSGMKNVTTLCELQVFVVTALHLASNCPLFGGILPHLEGLFPFWNQILSDVTYHMISRVGTQHKAVLSVYHCSSAVATWSGQGQTLCYNITKVIQISHALQCWVACREG